MGRRGQDACRGQPSRIRAHLLDLDQGPCDRAPHCCCGRGWLRLDQRGVEAFSRRALRRLQAVRHRARGVHRGAAALHAREEHPCEPQGPQRALALVGLRLTPRVMPAHSASKTRVNALMSRASTSWFLALRKTWMAGTSPAMTSCEVQADSPATAPVGKPLTPARSPAPPSETGPPPSFARGGFAALAGEGRWGCHCGLRRNGSHLDIERLRRAQSPPYHLRSAVRGVP